MGSGLPEMGSGLDLFLARARERELRAAASRAGCPWPGRAPVIPEAVPVTLRFASPDDAEALARLAVLDSSEPPELPALLADVDGRLRAALSLADGAVVADPFHPAEALIELLRARARQLEVRRPARRLRRLRVGLLRWRSALR
jgi:hypothetical protein